MRAMLFRPNASHTFTSGKTNHVINGFIIQIDLVGAGGRNDGKLELLLSNWGQARN